MSPRTLAELAGLTVVYFAAGKFGLSLAFEHASASSVWPPTGIALAAFLLYGRRVWPAIFLGALLVNLTTSGHVPSSFGIAAGNTLEGMVAAWLVERFAGGRAALQRAPGVFRFAALAGVIATTVSATIGVASLGFGGLAPADQLRSIWLTWWLGDAGGAIVVAPLVLLWSARSRLAWSPRRWAEAGLLAVAIVVTGLIVFRGLGPIAEEGSPLAFLTLPVMLWVAFRFGPRETVTASAMLAGFAVWGTLDRFGPFAVGSPDASLGLLQAFIMVVTIGMLAASAEVEAVRVTEAQIRRLNDELEARVAERTQELHKSEARLLEAQEVAHIGSWEWDIPANAIWWSDELCRLFGVHPGDFRASYEGYLARIHPEDRDVMAATVGRALEDRQPFSVEHRIVRPDGRTTVLHGRGRVLVDDNGRPVRMLGTAQDITDRKQAEEHRDQLVREQAARHEAEEANRMKDRFLATLSHELRTPINAVMGWARLLMDDRLDAADRAKGVHAIYKNALAQTQLASDILDATRIRSGNLRLDVGPVDLAAVIESAAESVRPSALVNDLTIELAVEPVSIVGDADRIGQVVRNLLTNAVKFSPTGRRVRLRSIIDGAYVQLTVEDEGPGISEAFLPHLFEPFRQADATATGPHAGLGLGLSIVRQLVELHGGEVWGRNRAEGGAVFTVRLPVGGPPPLELDPAAHQMGEPKAG